MTVDLVGAVVGWIVSVAGSAGTRILQNLAFGSDQERALRRVIEAAAHSVIPTVAPSISVGDGEHLCAVLLERADLSVSIDLEQLTSLSATLQVWTRSLDETGNYLTNKGIDPAHLGYALASEIWNGIRRDAMRGGPLSPVAEVLTHDRLLGLAELQLSELAAVRREVSRLTTTPDNLETIRPVRDELSRIERANRDWVTKTRNFYLQRLLQAIAEVEYPAGRLEASRVANTAMQKYGRGVNAGYSALLSICDELDSHELFRLNWKLRRMLARVVGDIIGLQLGPENWTSIGAFCEPRLETAEGCQLLAEAAVEHAAAARAIGAQVLYKLLLSPQPQVPWQLLRRWPLVSPVISSRVSLDTTMRLSNSSIRRMLLLTHLQYARHSSEELKSLLSEVRSSVNLADAGASAYLYRALVAWSRLNTSVEVSESSSLRKDYIRIEPLLYTLGPHGLKDGGLNEYVAEALELDSIERDLRNADGSYLPHPNEKFSEGRYGHTRHFVRLVLGVSSSDVVGSILLNFLNCADEGIRWAVAAEVLTWWTLVPDRDDAEGVVLRLIEDEHPWVTRETLQQLAKDELLCQSIGVNRLVHLAEGRRTRFEAEGWVTAELGAAIRRVAALLW